MTFLELCQRLRQECGVAGTGPQDVSGQRGEYQRLIDWVRDAWAEIQLERRDWRFNWALGELELREGERVYDLPDDFDRWDADTLRLAGDRLAVLGWDAMRDLPPTGGAPRRAAISPNGQIHLDGAPQEDGRLTFEYWRTPQRLYHRHEVPRLPERYHMLIVYRAMLQYALYEEAVAVTQQAIANEARLMRQMVISELPAIRTTGALA